MTFSDKGHLSSRAGTLSVIMQCKFSSTQRHFVSLCRCRRFDAHANFWGEIEREEMSNKERHEEGLECMKISCTRRAYCGVVTCSTPWNLASLSTAKSEKQSRTARKPTLQGAREKVAGVSALPTLLSTLPCPWPRAGKGGPLPEI